MGREVAWVRMGRVCDSCVAWLAVTQAWYCALASFDLMGPLAKASVCDGWAAPSMAHTAHVSVLQTNQLAKQ